MLFQDMAVYDVWTFVSATLVVALVCILLFEGAVSFAERGLDRRPREERRSLAES